LSTTGTQPDARAAGAASPRKRQKKSTMHPNFALHRLVDCVRPDLDEIQLARDRFGVMKRRLALAFPRARFVPIGSHGRGTAIAVHSHVDFLTVLPTEWARWGGRRVAPLTINDRITDSVGYLQAHSVVGRVAAFEFPPITSLLLRLGVSKLDVPPPSGLG